MVSRARAGLRDRWVGSVIQSDVGPACKLLLLVLAHYMTDHGKVSGLSRRDLATILAVSEPRVAARIGEASRAGLLDKVGHTGGPAGRSAQYVAVLPSRIAERYPTDRSGTEKRYVTTDTSQAAPDGVTYRSAIRPSRARIETQRSSATNIERDTGTSGASKDRSDEGVPPHLSIAAGAADERLEPEQRASGSHGSWHTTTMRWAVQRRMDKRRRRRPTQGGRAVPRLPNLHRMRRRSRPP